MRKFLVTYIFKGEWETGNGRCFMEANGKITQKQIEKWEKQIQEDGWDSVIITSFQKLEG